MSRHRHSPNRYRNYFQTHEQRLGQLYDTGFVLSDDIVTESVPGALMMRGSIHCLGGVIVEVSKRIEILDDSADPLVQTSDYSYNVSLGGVGNIVRFDSPHPTHNREHHVHTYDVLAGDVEGAVQFVYDPDKRPTIADVVHYAEVWFYQHRDRLIELGHILPDPAE